MEFSRKTDKIGSVMEKTGQELIKLNGGFQTVSEALNMQSSSLKTDIQHMDNIVAALVARLNVVSDHLAGVSDTVSAFDVRQLHSDLEETFKSISILRSEQSEVFKRLLIVLQELQNSTNSVERSAVRGIR